MPVGQEGRQAGGCAIANGSRFTCTGCIYRLCTGAQVCQRLWCRAATGQQGSHCCKLTWLWISELGRESDQDDGAVVP
jgi:hypothetical protein